MPKQLEIPFDEFKDTQLELPFRDEVLDKLFKEFDKKPPFSSFNEEEGKDNAGDVEDI